MNWVDGTKGALAVIAGVFGWIFGGWDMLIVVLLCLIVVDYVTGVIAAGINHQLSSSVGFRGILKKLCILLAVALGVLLDRYLGQPVCRTMVCTFYILNESLSVLENLGRAGVAYPAKLRDVILILNKKNDTGSTEVAVEDKIGQ
jgi:toxin secretion/phage lysis holin